jgi:hypothetical protein
VLRDILAYGRRRKDRGRNLYLQFLGKKTLETLGRWHYSPHVVQEPLVAGVTQGELELFSQISLYQMVQSPQRFL